MGIGGSKHTMKDFDDKVVVVTGGSRGIGLEFSKLAAGEGAKVAIIARDQARIDAAVEEIKAAASEAMSAKAARDSTFTPKEPVVVGLSFDLCKAEAAGAAIKAAEDALGGAIHLLVCSAGASHPGYFEELPPEVFVRQMEVNYLSAVFAAQAAFRSMAKTRRGHICLVSSMAGLLGTFGFSAYSPTKFAIRGLGEVLVFEGRPYNISISVLYPPDTETPGFEEENKIKPQECRLISEGGGLFSAEDVAQSLLKGIKKNKYTITTGMDGYFLGELTAGFARGLHVFQPMLMGILRMTVPFYHSQHNKIIDECHKERFGQAAAGEGEAPDDKKEQ